MYLSLLLRQLHVVKDPEDNSEQVLLPVFFKRYAHRSSNITVSPLGNAHTH